MHKHQHLKQLLVIFFLGISLFTSAQSAESFFKNAKASSEKEDYRSALTQIDKALKLDSSKVIYLNQKALILLGLKMYQESYDVYTKSLEVDPSYLGSYNDRGLLLYTIQQFDAAILDFSAGLEIAKTDSSKHLLLLNRAAAKIYKRNFMDAYDDLMTIYRKDSSDIGMLTNLASICDEIGKGNETLMYLERVIKIDPTNFPAYGNIGFKYQEMGDYKTAIKYFDKVLELQPNEPLGFSNRSFAKLKSGDIKGAYTDIEKSLSIYPNNSYAYRMRALIYIQDKKTELACKDLDKALELGFAGMYGEEVEQLKAKHCAK